MGIIIQDPTVVDYLQAFELAEILEATDGFSPLAKIGEGGFGAVYRGRLRGMPVAVKKLNQNSSQVGVSRCQIWS